MTEADRFFQELTSGWGDREVYSIEKHDIQDLFSFGGQIESNSDHGDGTFSLTIKFRNKKFICITAEQYQPVARVSATEITFKDVLRAHGNTPPRTEKEKWLKALFDFVDSARSDKPGPPSGNK